RDALRHRGGRARDHAHPVRARRPMITARTLPMTNPWTPTYRPKPTARKTLLCFPYAGGGATIYHGWQAAMPASIDVCPVELPGRLSRLRDDPIDALEPLLDALTRALAGSFERPY